MSSFTFDVGGKKAKGTVKKISGVVNHRFEATGKCPFCNKSFTVGNNPGQFRKESEVTGTLKFNIRRHYKTFHEGK